MAIVISSTNTFVRAAAPRVFSKHPLSALTDLTNIVPVMTRPNRSDPKAWYKNWIDATTDIEKIDTRSRHHMISNLITKFAAKGRDQSVSSLLYLLRIRAMIVLFFGASDSCAGSRKESAKWLAFLQKDYAGHGGWKMNRTKEQDDIIQGYQYTYALVLADRVDDAETEFTRADKEFGLVRHADYLMRNPSLLAK